VLYVYLKYILIQIIVKNNYYISRMYKMSCFVLDIFNNMTISTSLRFL